MIKDIMNILPHRFPFLLIDRVVELQEGQSVVAIKNITINEPCFQGHFPERPIYPGVLILESMAQTTALISHTLSQTEINDNQIYFFAGVNKARFKRQVKPGDQMIMRTELIKCSQGVSKFDCIAEVDGKVVCKAQLMGALREADT